MPLTKLATKFVQKRIKGQTTPKIYLVNNQETYDDLDDSGIIKFTNQELRDTLGKSPFYYSEFNNGTIEHPPLESVLGQERAKQLIDNIQAHKEWIGKNDAKVTFVPTVGVNSANPDTGLITINALDPATVHHELGHLTNPYDTYLYRFIRNRLAPAGPVTAALAYGARKAGFDNVFTKALQYGGAALPMLNYGATVHDEYMASKNAREFMKTHYNEEENKEANRTLDAGLHTYTKKWRLPAGLTAATILASLAGEKYL